MSAGRPGIAGARAAALLVLGALGLHQLRYLVAFGPDTGAVLQHEGHGYLAEAAPLLAAFAAAALTATVLVAAYGARPARACRPAFTTRALLFAAALLAVFCAQELVEGALAPAHPAGLAAVIGGGAWVAAPLALALGAAAAAVERLLHHADEALGPAPAPRPAAAAEPAGPSAGPDIVFALSLPLAFGLARRPPPVVAGT